MDLCQLTIKQAQEGLSKKEFSSVELVSACFKRIKQIELKIKAFITVCEKEALEEAEKADKIISRQPLLGIPIAIKDNFSTKGIRTTAGSKVLANYFPVYDATVVSRLKKAGAIIIGKTNLDAWAHGSSGENSDFYPTKNPWDLTMVPGGSSSGSAAAVAAGMSLAATGSDTGGSIRLPASFCNLVGLKPTYGRVSRYGVVAMASSLDAIGHLTKTVEDSAFLLNVIAGQDGFDATMPKVKEANYVQNLDKGVKNLKIGLPKEYFQEGIDPQIKQKVLTAVKILEKLGVKATEISLPHTQYALATYYIICPAEISSNLARYDGIRFGNDRRSFGDEAKRRIMLGTYTLSAGYRKAYYLKSMQVRTLLKKDFDDAFKKVDIIITPVSPTLPWKLGEKIGDPLKMYLSDIFTVTANLAGLPALAVPCGFVNTERVELPVGMQIIGPQFSESLLFRVGYSYEQETGWYKKKPPLA